jgi:hypothetical protein
VNPTTVAWRGLTMATGQDTDYRIIELEGWEELPAPRYDKTPRTNSHGVHPSKVWSDERIVTVTGFSWSAAERDARVAELQSGLAFGDDEEPLTITAAGRTLTAQAQLLAARAALLRGEWGVGRFGWLAQWRCPDPLRYGPETTLSTGLPDAGGGLTYPLAYDLDYGAAGATGSITLTNAGTADAPIVFAVRGPLEQGFEISAGGQRLRYPVAVPAGQVLELDTAAGTVLVEGTASRRGNLTVADWMRVPKKGSLTVQFTSLGGARDPAAQLSATWAEAHW